MCEVGLRAAGSKAPDEHAQLLTAAVTGLLLKQLAYPEPNFTARVLEPLLNELTASLLGWVRFRLRRGGSRTPQAARPSGASRDRTGGLRLAKPALFQLSYGPV